LVELMKKQWMPAELSLVMHVNYEKNSNYFS
jgi:hypothetical protein